MKRATGFTLFEVLAALALLSLLLLGVYAGIRSATHTVQAGELKIEQLDEVRSSQQFLRRELTQALAQQIARDDSGNAVFFIGSSDEMRFVAPLPGYLGKMGPQLIDVKLVPNDKDGKRLVASLAEMPPDGSPMHPLGEPQTLIEEVVDGHFSYRGINAQGQPMDWQSDWKIAGNMPSIVEIKLTLANGREWPLMSAPLRVNAAAVQGAGLLRGLQQPPAVM
jgi:general secretion pathway protein J